MLETAHRVASLPEFGHTILAMSLGIQQIAFLVRDYDEAIAFFTEKLGFEVTSDQAMKGGKRWVTVAPEAGGVPRLVLSLAATPEQAAFVGKQAGGRVFLFLHTTNFDETYEIFSQRGISFVESPRNEPYGKVAVFLDLYGNRWDLIEPRS